MDDPTRTRKTLDDLADLFLTGTAASPGLSKDPRPSLKTAQTPTAIPRRSPPVSLDAPPPVKLVGNATPIPKPSNGHTATDPKPHDRHDNAPPWAYRPETPFQIGPPPSKQSPAPSTKHRVEAVLLGNLPGFSAPWLTQYAHRLADQHGPVGVVSLGTDEVDLDLVATDQRFLDQFDAPDSPDGSATVTLPTMLSTLSERVRTWLVEFPTPLTPQTQRQMSAFNRWSVLSGADDAAIVGAYRLLKQLASPTAHEDDTQPLRAGQHHIGVVMLGSDEATGRAAVAKLSQAGHGFLRTPVRCIGSYQKMQPVRCRHLGTFTDQPENLWAQIHQCLVKAQDNPMPTEPSDTVEASIASTDPIAIHTAVARPQRTPPRVSTGPQPFAHLRQPRPPRPDNNRPDPPSSQPNDAPKSPAVAGTPDLCAWVGQNIQPLQARCPELPQIQLGLDQDLCLHLLAHHTAPANEADNAASDPAHSVRPLDATIVDLIHAGRWAQQHLRLLELTDAQRGRQWREQIVLHLLTDRSDALVQLVNRVGSLLKCHLLKKVGPPDHPDWLCVPMN